MCQVTERQAVPSLMTWVSREGKQGWENKKSKMHAGSRVCLQKCRGEEPKGGQGNNVGNNAGKAALSSGK